MRALEPFDVTLTFCFTPEHLGIAPHHTSPPKDAGGLRGILRADDAAVRVERAASDGVSTPAFTAEAQRKATDIEI